MKKIIFGIITIMILLTACNNAVPITYDIDDGGEYTGFLELPTDYTMDMAGDDGHLIKEDGQIVANEGSFDSFIKKSKNGEDTMLRMVSFQSDADDVYFCDLFYRDGLFYLFDSSAKVQTPQSYKYLLKINGTVGIPKKDRYMYILTDDDTLTYDLVFQSMFSSNSEVIKSISKHRIIMFGQEE